MTTHPDPSKLGDRELDALVAEKVFGCRVDFDCGHCVDGLEHEVHGDNRPWCNCEKDKHYSDSEGLDTLPYSTDISAAWQVVEKMEAEGFEWMVSDDEVYFQRGRLEWKTLKKTDDYAFGGTGNEKGRAPRYICLAALKATENK